MTTPQSLSTDRQHELRIIGLLMDQLVKQAKKANPAQRRHVLDMLLYELSLLEEQR